MPKYNVYATEQLHYCEEIEAENTEQAREKFADALNASELNPVSSELSDINVDEYEEA